MSGVYEVESFVVRMRVGVLLREVVGPRLGKPVVYAERETAEKIAWCVDGTIESVSRTEVA